MIYVRKSEIILATLCVFLLLALTISVKGQAEALSHSLYYEAAYTRASAKNEVYHDLYKEIISGAVACTYLKKEMQKVPVEPQLLPPRNHSLATDDDTLVRVLVPQPAPTPAAPPRTEPVLSSRTSQRGPQ